MRNLSHLGFTSPPCMYHDKKVSDAYSQLPNDQDWFPSLEVFWVKILSHNRRAQ